MAKSRKRRTPVEPPPVGKLVGMCIRLFSTGKEFMLAAAGLVAAIVALSGSCSNLQRTDASYAALASKVNDMSSRLNSIEASLDDLKSGKAFTCEPSAMENRAVVVLPEPTPPVEPPVSASASAPAFHIDLSPTRAPLPETLDMLMQQQIAFPPEVKK